MSRLLYIVLTGVFIVFPDLCAGQEMEKFISRAEQFSFDSLSPLVRNADISGQWLQSDRYFYYSVEDSLGRAHYIVDTKTGTRSELFDRRFMSLKINELSHRGGVALEQNSEGQEPSRQEPTKQDPTQLESTKQSPVNIGVVTFEDDNPKIFSFRHEGKYYRYDTANQSLTETKEPKTLGLARNPDWYKSYSADSLYYIVAKGHNLVLYRRSAAPATSTAANTPATTKSTSPTSQTPDSLILTTNGERYNSYAIGGDSEKSPEELSSPIGLWVGDSHKYFLIREDKRKVGTLTLINSLSQPRPTAKTYKFAMPGDEYVPQYEILVIDADTMAATIQTQTIQTQTNDQSNPRTITHSKTQTTTQPIKTILPPPYKDQKITIPRFSRFTHSDRYIWFTRTNRQCDTLELCRVDATDASLKVIISETCKPHYCEQLFSYHILNEGKEILWWSERTGKGRYYLYDSEGRLKHPLTDEDFVSGPIVRIDTTAREIIFEGYGREKDINPHYRLYYKASIDAAKKPVCLTPGNGTHSIRFSSTGKYIIDKVSRMDMAPQHRIRDRKGREIYRLEDCDLSALYAKGWKEPRLMKLHAADSVTDLYGVVYLPFDLDTTKKYPIISNVYPGPQVDLVPQEFFVDDNYNQSLAQLGFIVLNFAYRGSGPLRGRDFYTHGYGNLRDYPLDDDYAVIRQIGELLPYADTTRVGIYGHSGGGFMAATAQLTRPDFYKVAVAASGNYDNNIYSQWWGESFHGIGAPQGNINRSHIPTTCELAAKLKGRLLLITGDMDNNVHPANTMRLADALIKENKYFDMMIFPGADHGVGGKYYINLIRRYFARHLLSVED